jgi:3-oxoacyl-[acyl-carrier-protein] synthase-3
MTEAGERAMAAAGLTARAIDWWIPHQANRRITQEVGQRLGISAERTIDTIQELGNSSAATIPMALAGAVQAGHIRRGHYLLLTAVGAGVISAGVVVQW